MRLRHPSPDDPGLAETAHAAAKAATVPATGFAAEALTLARSLSSRALLPGQGRTRELWEVLATVAAADVAVARVLEPHLDAQAILGEAGMPREHERGTWGVYAAEQPGVRLVARPDPGGGPHWLLDGTKPWCSLAGEVDHALVTAWVDEDRRGLFAVELDQPGVRVVPGAWASRGLPDVPSGPVELTQVRARPVGEPGWYLERDGFAWGGIGVAAVWYGGAVGVARRVLAGARRREPDQVARMHLGTLDAALLAARSVLADAATAVDSGAAAGAAGATLALRVRQVVADTVERVLHTADHALGPGPLALEESHARRVADLRLYVRQHHAERDLAALGTAVREADDSRTVPW